MDKKEALYWMEEYESYWNDACCELQELRKLIDFEYTWKDKKLTVIEKGYFGAGGAVAFIPSMTQADIKRNKQVDVPTEQWQKDIERKVEVLMQRMDRVEPKCIFNWSKYNQDAEKWDKLFNELNDADK